MLRKLNSKPLLRDFHTYEGADLNSDDKQWLHASEWKTSICVFRNTNGRKARSDMTDDDILCAAPVVVEHPTVAFSPSSFCSTALYPLQVF
jgi:hypothetical protein